MRVIVHLFIFVFCALSSAQNTQLFEEGNTLYNQEKYSEAIEKYEAILKTGEHSADLYFNLANAHYRLNNIAPSIYNYEKALQLAPNDKDIQNNLAFAQNMTIDAISEVPQVGFSRIFNNMVNIASKDTWAIVSIVCVALFVLLFLLYHFSYSSSRKRFAFVTSILSLLIGCIAVAMAFQKVQLEKNDNPAIIFVQESRVMSDPKKSSEEVFRLHEGTKVQVLESYGDWKKIKITDNSTGWISLQDIKLLNVF